MNVQAIQSQAFPL